MDIAALITWVVTAGGGFTLLVIWLSRRRQPARIGGGDAGATGAGAAGPADADADVAAGRSRLTPQLIFSHAGLAVLGLILWIVYLATDSTGLARVTLVVVLVVALIGFAMLTRWVRGRPGSRQGTGGSLAADAGARPEDGFPVPVIVAHGVFAAVTLVLVLIVALRG